MASPIGHEQADRSAHKRQEQALSEELTDQAPPACPQRQSHRPFFLPRRAPRQKEVCHVCAGNQQDESHHRHQNHKRLGELRAQKLDASAAKVSVTLSFETCTRHYVEAYERYYAPFMERRPFLLENYLINHVIRMGFPFHRDAQGQSIGPHQQFLLMCVEFALIKGLLIGMAGHYREAFAADHVVKLVQVVAKSMEHSGTFIGGLNWHGLADPNSVAALLRN